MRFQWKLLIMMLVLGLLPSAVMRTIGARAVSRVGDELMAQAHERRLKNSQNRLRLLVESYTSKLRKDRDTVELALRLQADKIEHALAEKPDSQQRLYFVDELRDNPPIEMKSSKRHARVARNGELQFLDISLNAQVFKAFPGVDSRAITADAQRLTTLTPFYQVLYQNTRDLVLWHSTALANGLYCSYPAHAVIPRHLDPRELAWYKTEKGPSDLWVDPYVDPATRQIVMSAVMPVRYPAGRIAGVTSITVPESTLLEEPLMMDNISVDTKPFVCDLAIHPDTKRLGARITAKPADSELARRHWKAILTPEWLMSADQQAFNAMIEDVQNSKIRFRRMPFQDRDSLWVYGPIQMTKSFVVLITPYDTILEQVQEGQQWVQLQIDRLQKFTGYSVILVILLVLVLGVTFSRTVTRPLAQLVDGAKRLADGDFDYRVDIRTKDEFGGMGRVFNQIGPELKERYRLQRSMDLAMEVQQHLLPDVAPQYPGLDVSGRIIYCDEIGGDYYDYIPRNLSDCDCLDIVVGDVSGHGSSAALLMTTARALIRQRMAMPGDLSQVIGDVNRLLCHDVRHSGGFMTMFCLQLDPVGRRCTWVRAGHDPAMVYEPQSDTIHLLKGSGLPLGVDDQSIYDQGHQILQAGQVVLIGTDGIWEALDPQGRMFGKRALQNILQRHCQESADTIVTKIFEALDQHRQGRKAEDDITLVVAKIERPQT